MTGLGALRTLWAEKGVDPAALVVDADGTLMRSDRRRLAESATLASDPGDLPPRAHVLSPQRLAIGEVLGRGGMGIVRLAEQTGLRRDVAVKTALDRRDPGAVAALLKEAWVGAALEHPSIVPVHTLASFEDGPAIVMKRVDGRPWSDALGVAREGEPREADLRIVARVCHAIAFVHSRGILHLDLKPENVMLGAHGEVYVLDWGLAAAHGPRGPGWLPAAASIETIAGTPSHMAPELALADGARIGPRTDVYLLGALLHQVITGRPLHDGGSLVEVLLHAYESPPATYDSEVPRELVRIVHRATDRDPERRFAGAEELREAIEGYLRHRRADRLARRALEGLLALDRILARDRATDADIEPRMAEVAVAIEQARRGWPEHPELARLEDALLERRAEQAIRAERPDAAERFAARMAAPPAALTARIAALRARVADRARHVERLEEMRRELDRTLGDRDRRRLMMTLGLAWAVVCVAFGVLTRAGLLAIGYRELAIEGAMLVAVLGPIALVMRQRFFVNRANRRLWGGLALAAGTVELFWVACWMLGIAPAAAIAATLFFYVYSFVTLGFVFDRRMILGAIPLGVAAAVATFVPAYLHDAIGLGGALAVAAVLAAPQRAAA